MELSRFPRSMPFSQIKQRHFRNLLRTSETFREIICWYYKEFLYALLLWVTYDICRNESRSESKKVIITDNVDLFFPCSIHSTEIRQNNRNHWFHLNFNFFFWFLLLTFITVNLQKNNVSKSSMNKSCVMNTTAGYVIMFIQNDFIMLKTSFSPN